MTDRDRLISKIMSLNKPTISLLTAMDIVDAIIECGVIVSPCKVGDKVYLLGVFTGQIIETEIIGIGYNKSGIYLLCENYTTISAAEQLGETVFLTKEEAEAKLKEREQNAR